MNFQGSNLTWLLVLLLIIGDGDNGVSCDSLIWLLLLSRYCGGSCGCGNNGGGNGGCGCGGNGFGFGN